MKTKGSVINSDKSSLENRCVIYAPNGEVVSNADNLIQIRRWVSQNLVRKVVVTRRKKVGAHLYILFDDEFYFKCNWASYAVLCGALRRWRNLYGAPIYAFTTPMGIVESKNHFLRKGEERLST